jgi:hypothetical protein
MAAMRGLRFGGAAHQLALIRGKSHMIRDLA